MRRKVTKHGNESYSIVLPKPWVTKNHLKPKEEIEIIESENRLIISPQPVQYESDQEVLVVDSDSEDILISKLINIYRLGFSHIKIIHTKNNTEILSRLTAFASKMHGVIIEQKDNTVIVSATEGIHKKSEILNKSFLNLLWLSELITEENLRNSGWQKQVFDVYEKIYFLCEYMYRIISIEGETEFHLALKQHATAGTIQCLAEILKKVGDTEAENSITIVFGGVSMDLKNIVRLMHDVCTLNKNPADFYKVREIIISKISDRKYNVSCIGYAHMCEYFCTKLVRQEIETLSNVGKFKKQNY